MLTGEPAKKGETVGFWFLATQGRQLFHLYRGKNSAWGSIRDPLLQGHGVPICWPSLMFREICSLIGAQMQDGLERLLRLIHLQTINFCSSSTWALVIVVDCIKGWLHVSDGRGWTACGTRCCFDTERLGKIDPEDQQLVLQERDFTSRSLN